MKIKELILFESENGTFLINIDLKIFVNAHKASQEYRSDRTVTSVIGSSFTFCGAPHWQAARGVWRGARAKVARVYQQTTAGTTDYTSLLDRQLIESDSLYILHQIRTLRHETTTVCVSNDCLL